MMQTGTPCLTRRKNHDKNKNCRTLSTAPWSSASTKTSRMRSATCSSTACRRATFGEKDPLRKDTSIRTRLCPCTGLTLWGDC